MRTKRNLFILALGGVTGYVLGRYPRESLEKVRNVAGAGVGLARERVTTMSVPGLPLGRPGDHRSPNAQRPKTTDGAGDGDVDRDSMPYIDRAHP
ncbi:MAG: hypothetical protein ACRDPS_14015 [Nocardioides sp.]|uniref:hypothetical protein n=1 Tax=Nocardioides sp. TaxID=35761 RepID=UPI003D6C097B